MSRFIVRPSLTILRILVFAGALASVLEPHLPYQSLTVSPASWIVQPQFGMLDSQTMFRIIFTAVSISLL